MIFIEEDRSTIRFSKMRSNAAMLRKKTMLGSPSKGALGSRRTSKNNMMSPKKPSHLSKRSVSLPTALDNTTVKTRKLFWFIPTDHRHRRRKHRWDNGYPERKDSHLTSGSDVEQEIENGRIFHERRLPLRQDIPEQVALEWITTSSTYSLSDSTTSDHSEDHCYDDDHESRLFGLEFLDAVTETNIEK